MLGDFAAIVSTSPMERRNHCKYKVLLNLYPMMKHFCPDDSGLFWGDNSQYTGHKG